MKSFTNSKKMNSRTIPYSKIENIVIPPDVLKRDKANSFILLFEAVF